MGTLETNTSHNPFEFSSLVRDSGIKKQVQEVIFSSDTSQEPEVNKNGLVFNLMPVFSGIYRFIVEGETPGEKDHITVTDSLVESKVKAVDSITGKEKVVEHIWNCPKTLDKIKGYLEIHSPNSTKYKQEVLFDF